jgi:uncharacterized protein (DUF2384 family)
MSVAIVPIEVKDFAKLVARTVEVFGTAERAVAWLETSNPKLGGATPLRAYQTSRGEQVEEELSAIEHGVAA